MRQVYKDSPKNNYFVRFQIKGTGEKKQEYGSVQRSVWVNGTCKQGESVKIFLCDIISI
jgi:hypothetical protein